MKTLPKLLFAFLLCPLISSPVIAQTTFVHLFEWKWNDIASECENFLGPKGYAAVQVSPPQKSVAGSFWWTRYQPVSYAIEGRSGTRAEFASMVARCKTVGVDIYVDAVINHMSAGNRNFPEVPYDADDFHTCTTNIDYTNAWQVQNCDLVGLNDLKTESYEVREKIAAYMNDLLSMGVAGFRIDAAKHMPSGDVADIVNRLNGNPYIFQEVIGAVNEPITPAQYTYISDVTEFNFSSTLGHYFKGRAPLKDLRNIGVWSGWLASSDAVTFVANHDNQRQNTSNIVTHKDGMNVNNIAHVFMLAYPYGYPQVMSSYDWNDHDQGPPTSAASNCNNGWLCEHRNREIANMVGFRNATKDAFYLSNWWDNGSNQIAFGRGSRGFVVINGQNNNMSVTLQTGLAAGSYCDVVNGDFVNGTCTGPSITVAADGTATFTVATKSASAIHVQAKNGETVGNNCVYSSMKLRGTFNNWTATDMNCVTGTWVGSATFSGSNTGRLKFDAYGNWVNNWGNNNSDLIADASGNDILVTTPGTYTITFNDANLQYSITPANNASSSSAQTSSSSSSSSTNGNVSVTFTCQNGTTYAGQSVYVVGAGAALGNWTAASAIKLNPTSYPTWTGTIQLPANTAVEWKCLKREENNAAAGVVWESGSNNSLNTGSTTTTLGAF
ncbi:MAG: carbohydrate-binding module family 20 domain-containing protein [Cellvibrio sp.]|uniref:carbohydrate-binding module family 20 domain-containing protein n=1 Tax=Cellvibrio sp. TaxID=1965322 RepID=UPI00271F1A23|nr:carbohydrate-binding module family 20 domain-containing protein [Cellvibrio sp.]